MIRNLVAKFTSNPIPKNSKLELNEDGTKLYATFDIKDVYKEGDLIAVEWNNPAHEEFTDKCVCAVHVKDDPMYEGKNFLYIVKGSYVDMTISPIDGIARRLKKDCIGIAESEIVSIRNATNYERILFYDVLRANMLDYKDCKIVPYIVKPSIGVEYYTIYFRTDHTEGFEFTKGEYAPHKFVWTKKSEDAYRGDIIFDSLDACEEACKKLNDAIKKQANIIRNIIENENE